MKSAYFDGAEGETVRWEEIPEEFTEKAEATRQAMMESLSMYSDELMELLLSEEEVPHELLHRSSPMQCA